jgi:hypothetical protein
VAVGEGVSTGVTVEVGDGAFAGSVAVGVAVGEPVDVGGGEPVDVGGGEPVDVGGGEPVDVGGGEPVDVGGGEPVDVGGGVAVDGVVGVGGSAVVVSVTTKRGAAPTEVTSIGMAAHTTSAIPTQKSSARRRAAFILCSRPLRFRCCVVRGRGRYSTTYRAIRLYS